MNKREENLLFEVIARHFTYKEATKSENPVVKEFAERLLDINIWELWALTQ